MFDKHPVYVLFFYSVILGFGQTALSVGSRSAFAPYFSGWGIRVPEAALDPTLLQHRTASDRDQMNIVIGDRKVKHSQPRVTSLVVRG